MTRAFVWGAIFVATACSTRASAPAPAQSATPIPIPTPTPTPTLIPTAAPLAVIDAAAPEAKYVDDVAAWLGARHAKVPAALGTDASCTEEKLGTNDALLCHSNPDSLQTGESVYPITVWIVANGRADLALSAASGAGPLDREFEPGGAPRDDTYIELDVTISGSTLTIAERPRRTCTQVLAQYTSREWDGHRRVVQKACAARGRYTLQNGKLVRAP
jgi:hypothetical protein